MVFEKTENKQKRARGWPILKKRLQTRLKNCFRRQRISTAISVMRSWTFFKVARCKNSLSFVSGAWRRSVSSVTSKKSLNVDKKWPKTDFTRKWKILTPLPNCPKMWQFGENNCFHRLRKVGQSAINRPIWSHWLECLTLIRLCVRIPLQLQDKWGQLYQN